MPYVVVSEVSQFQADLYPAQRFFGEVEAGPTRPAADQLLGLGSLTETDLENLLTPDVERVEASRGCGIRACSGLRRMPAKKAEKSSR